MHVANRGLARHLGEQPRGLDAVRPERHARVAVRRDRLVMAVGTTNLRYVLGYQAGFDPVAGDQRQRFGEHVEAAESREFVYHQKEPVTVACDRTPMAVLKSQI